MISDRVVAYTARALAIVTVDRRIEITLLVTAAAKASGVELANCVIAAIKAIAAGLRP